MTTYTDSDDWFDNCTSWKAEVGALRAIVLDAGLVETLKWKHPCYTDNDRNILIISKRKQCAIISFLNGALIDEPQGRFVQPGIDRSVRYLGYKSVEEVNGDRAYIETLISKAVDAKRAGLRVEPLPDEIEYVEELRTRLDADDGFRTAFEALTPGRRRGYNLHFSQSKKSSTREARIARCEERIFQGKGLRDCVCGHTKRPPGCDGSHKHFE